MKYSTIDLGFIYNSRDHQQIKELIPFFLKWSEQNQVRVGLYCLSELNMEEECVKGYILQKGKEDYNYIKIPYYNYNFALHTTKSNKKKMRNLRKNKTITVINPINSFNQSILFEIISTYSQTKQFLLPFQDLNEKNLMQCINANVMPFLMMEKSSNLPKLIRIKKAEKETFNIYYGQNKKWIGKKDLWRHLQKAIQDKPYLILEGKTLMEWDGAPLEARFYVQKQPDGEWKVEQRLVKQSLFSNDKVYDQTLEEVLEKSSPRAGKEIENELDQLSRYLLHAVDYHIPFLGSCVLDFVFDEKGHPYLVYFGGWDTNQFLFSLKDQSHAVNYIQNAFSYLLQLKKHTEEERRM